MSDTTYQTFQHYGTNAQRLAFTPNPAAGIQPIYIWYETDTGDTYIYDTSWHLVTSGGAGNINVSAGTTSNNLTRLVFSNSNSISFGLNGSTITATVSYPTQTNQTLGLFASSQTTAQSSSSTIDARSLTIRGAGIVSVGLSAGEFIVSASAAAGGGITNINLSAGTTSQNLSNFVLSNSNNVSFGLNGSTVTATVTVATSLTNVNISAGTTSQNLSNLVFSNSNNVSFGLNGSTITGSIATSLTNINISAGTTSNNLSAVVFSNSNGFSFGLNGSTVTGSYTVPTVTNSSWTVSDNATSGTVARLAFTNLNGLTLSLSTGAGGSHTIVGSHNGITSQSNQQMTVFATSNTTQGSSGTTNASSLIFAGAGVASVGITNGSIVVSVPAGGGGITNINVSAGTTSQNLSNLVFSDTNGHSFGLSGSTITVKEMVYSGFEPYKGHEWLVQQYTNNRLFIYPLDNVPNFQFDQVAFPIFNSNSSNLSGSHTLSYGIGLYTRTGSTLSLAMSTTFTTAITHSGTVGSYSLYSGLRLMSLGWTTTVTMGNYWLGAFSRSSTAGADGTYSYVVGTNLGSNLSGVFGFANNASYQVRLGQGSFSTTTGAMPDSIGFTEITGTTLAFAIRPAIMYFNSASF